MQEPFILDVRKLLCPLPVIRLQKTIQSLKTNDRIVVLATDPGVLFDIPAWCRIHGHTILGIKESNAEIQIEVVIQ